METGKEPAYQENTDYVDKLMAALDHPDSTVRLNAAHILGEKRAVRAVSRLIEAYRGNENDPYILKEIVWALGEIGEPASLALISAASQRSFLLVRVEAIRAIAKIGGPQTRLALEEATADPNSAVREEALLALEVSGKAGKSRSMKKC
ncbi:MAG: HEAT repeat domain-containing protein [Firmicutes bacterium]|nr:HEAT repeat domain-containing protein [Bacillota bacterium]MCL5038341.1 HEAT repeat domain-containing protein [Bacillota bacterium]